MCGRITQKSNPNQLGLKIVSLIEPLYPDNTPPRYNGAPGQEHWVIRQNPKTERTLDRLWWGLIPYWNKDEKGGRKPINAKAETIATLPTFRDAYAKRRCILPIDNFFEWKAIKGEKAKQPYAIAMKSGEPFGLAAIWENWRRPDTEEWVRTFAVITCLANELMADIHDRMPVIIAPESYDRWLGTLDPNPSDLLTPFPSELMKIWAISVRVNEVTNDDADLLAPSVRFLKFFDAPPSNVGIGCCNLPERIVHRRLISSAVLASLFAALPGAHAHEWYPLECCSGQDCTPADTVVRRDDGSYLVTARGMSVMIPGTYRHWRPSPDGQVHVCIRPFRSGGVMLICAFRGPGA